MGIPNGQASDEGPSWRAAGGGTGEPPEAISTDLMMDKYQQRLVLGPRGEKVQ
jgi:hypothetical protein